MNHELKEVVAELVEKELNNRQFLSPEKISEIVTQSTRETIRSVFQLMGVKIKDNGEIDFETARENNDFVTRLRRGSDQTKRLIFSSCILTFVSATLALVYHAVVEYTQNHIR